MMAQTPLGRGEVLPGACSAPSLAGLPVYAGEEIAGQLARKDGSCFT